LSVFFTDLDNTLIYSHKREIGEEKTVVEYLDGRQQSFMTNYTYKYLKNAKWLDIVPVTTRIDTQFKRITCMNELNILEDNVHFYGDFNILDIKETGQDWTGWQTGTEGVTGETGQKDQFICIGDNNI